MMDTEEIKRAIEKFEGEYDRWKFDFLVERLIDGKSITWETLTENKTCEEKSTISLSLNFLMKEKLIFAALDDDIWYCEITQKGIDWLKKEVGYKN